MGKSYPMHEQLNSLLGILSEDLKWEFLRGQLLTHRSVREASDNEPQHEGSDWASSITRYLNRYGRQLGKVVHEDALPKDLIDVNGMATLTLPYFQCTDEQPGGYKHGMYTVEGGPPRNFSSPLTMPVPLEYMC